MELVKAYVILGFKSQKSIHPDDVERIVDRYLSGHDIHTIAKEEAIRIRNEFRERYITLHHTSSPTEGYVPIGPLTGDEDNLVQRYRLEEAPQKPKPSGLRYEGQRPDDTMEEHEVRNKMMGWNFMMLISSLLVFVTNVAVAIFRIAFDYEFSFPIGVIPLPLLIYTLIMRQKRSNELYKMKRKREEEEVTKR